MPWVVCYTSTVRIWLAREPELVMRKERLAERCDGWELLLVWHWWMEACSGYRHVSKIHSDSRIVGIDRFPANGEVSMFLYDVWLWTVQFSLSQSVIPIRRPRLSVITWFGILFQGTLLKRCSCLFMMASNTDHPWAESPCWWRTSKQRGPPYSLAGNPVLMMSLGCSFWSSGQCDICWNQSPNI